MRLRVIQSRAVLFPEDERMYRDEDGITKNDKELMRRVTDKQAAKSTAESP